MTNLSVFTNLESIFIDIVSQCLLSADIRPDPAFYAGEGIR